jgi:hypothetical protein
LRPRPIAAVAAATAVALLAACGKKEDPQPPPNPAPARVADLAVGQRGGEIVLRFTYPSTTVGGLALPGIERVEIRRLIKTIAPAGEEATGTPEEEPGLPDAGAEGAADEPAEASGEAAGDEAPEAGATEPQPISGWTPALLRELARLVPAGRFGVLLPLPPEVIPSIDALEFEASSELLLTLEGEELDRAIVGDQVAVTVALDEVPPPPVPGAPPPDEVHAYGVATVASTDLVSPISNPQAIVPAAPPPAPASLAVTPSETGVQLSWEGADDPLAGFYVYRRDAASARYGAPLARVSPVARVYRDTTAVFGVRYVYALTAVARTAPVLESGFGSEQEVDHQDRYPPPVPERPVALGESGQVRLLWDTSLASDLAGYLVDRWEGEGPARRLNSEPLAEPELVDTDVVTGTLYRYRIRAVDTTGNLSAPSVEVEATPR